MLQQVTPQPAPSQPNFVDIGVEVAMPKRAVDGAAQSGTPAPNRPRGGDGQVLLRVGALVGHQRMELASSGCACADAVSASACTGAGTAVPAGVG